MRTIDELDENDIKEAIEMFVRSKRPTVAVHVAVQLYATTSCGDYPNDEAVTTIKAKAIVTPSPRD